MLVLMLLYIDSKIWKLGESNCSLFVTLYFILLDYVFNVNLNHCSSFVTFYITLAFSWDHCASTSLFVEIKNILVVNFTNEPLSKSRPFVGAPGYSEPWICHWEGWWLERGRERLWKRFNLGNWTIRLD